MKNFSASEMCSNCPLQIPQQENCKMSDWVWTYCRNCLDAEYQVGGFYRCSDGVVREGCRCGNPK